jgi:RNA polymerase sigma factor (sigma-70 family)
MTDILHLMGRASGQLDGDVDPQARALDLRDTEATWAALAHEALGGDVEATRRLFDAIAPVVRRVCHGVLGHRHLDLEDTVQECLVDVLRALPQYRFEGHLVHYVTKIAIRRAILTRRRGVRRLRSLRVLEVLQGSDAVEPAGRSAAEQARMVSEVIARVSQVQGEALILRVVLGFSVDEIASITSVPVNTVKTRLRLAKNALRRVADLGARS